MDFTLCVTPIDGDLLTEGYLTSWDGKTRFIHELAPLGRMAQSLGAQLFWDMPGAITRDHLAVCSVSHRRIYLKPVLFKTTPTIVLHILEHELGHCWKGFPEPSVLEWVAIIQGWKLPTEAEPWA